MGLYDRIQQSDTTCAKGDEHQPESVLNQQSAAPKPAEEKPVSNAQEGSSLPCTDEVCRQTLPGEALNQDPFTDDGKAQPALKSDVNLPEEATPASREAASNEQPQPQKIEPSVPCQEEKAQRGGTNPQAALLDRLLGEAEAIRQILHDQAKLYQHQRQALEQQTKLLEQQNQVLIKQQQMLASTLRENASFQVQVRGEMLRELEAFRKQHSGEALIPPLKAVAQLYCNHYSLTQEPCEDPLGKKIKYLFEDLVELLEEYDVKLARTEPYGERSLRLSAARYTLPTDNHDLHGKVAYSHNPSFALGQTVLVREQVDVYIYQEPAQMKPAITQEVLQSSLDEVSQPSLPKVEQ